MRQTHVLLKKSAALILAAMITLSLTSCDSNGAAPESENAGISAQPPSDIVEMNSSAYIQRIEKELDTNLKVSADVLMPASSDCKEYQLKYRDFTPDELSNIFLKDDESGKNLSTYESGFEIVTENGANINTQKRGFTYTADSLRTDEIVGLFEHYYNPDSPAMTEELSFMPREDAIQKGIDIIQQLDIACTPRAGNIVALTNKQLSDLQSALMQDSRYKGFYDAGKSIEIKDWSDADDAYYITYYFVQDDIQLYEQDNEPSVSMAVEWFPGSIKAEMLITSKGIRYMKLDGALSFDGQPTSKKIISVDGAMDKLKDKYSQVILTEPYTVTKIYLEYLTIPEKDKKPLEAMQTLRPYWCFIIQVLEDDNGQIFEKAERFNAFAGADLSYGG